MKQIKLFTLLLLALLTFSCEKDSLDLSMKPEIIENNSVLEDDYRIINGYLVFKSYEALQKTQVLLNTMTEREQNQWEARIGFYSQRRIMQDIISKEYTLDSIAEIKYAETDINIDQVPQNEIHPEIYFKALDKGMIRLIAESTIDEYYEFSPLNKPLTDILDINGLYAIADTLYQLNGNMYKVMKATNISDPSTLMNATESNVDQGILVTKYGIGLKSQTVNSVGNSYTGGMSAWANSGGGKKGEKRIRIHLDFEKKGYAAAVYSTTTGEVITPPRYSFKNNVYVECMERNFWRKWKYKSTKIWVDGSWNMRVFKYPQNYHNRYSFEGYASHFKSSVNPDTGLPSPFESYFSVSGNTINCGEDYVTHQEVYPPHLTSFTWKATRHGGTSGLRATISYP